METLYSFRDALFDPKLGVLTRHGRPHQARDRDRPRVRACLGAQALLGHWPGYSIARHRAEMMSSRPALLAQRNRLLEALRQAGLPER